ncbi:hypothetical protein [Sulfurimonas sp.]
MIKAIILFFLITIYSVLLSADSLQEFNYIDKPHDIISTHITNYMNNISSSIDNFLKTKKYIDETKQSFINVTLDTNLQSKYANKINITASAHINLQHINKKLTFFINNITDKKPDQIINKNSSTELGINYFQLGLHKIQKKYSFGIRGLNLFVRARYYKKFHIHTWTIEPIQIFEYSVQDYFKEETSLYFDKTLTQNKLFRIILQRQTQSKIRGMDYNAQFQYYWSFNKKAAFSITEIFSGNTKYKIYETSPVYKGINNYTTTLTFRKNIWRKWFFYEIHPSVNFHKENNYEPNYAITFLINLYFGKYN